MTDWEELFALLDDTPCDEIVVETEAQRNLFRRTEANQWVRETITLHAPVLLSGPIAAPTAAKPQVQAENGTIDIRAPLPGIFYRAPKPGAAPFVELGVQVGQDTVVGIIETMKLMNSVSAGAEGEIAEICVGNGSPVDASDIVMRVRPR